MKTITLELRPADAEPILREAAEHAAKYSAWCDHMTLKTCDRPRNGNEPLADTKTEWRRKFLRAKRIVEAFGVEYEQTTEAETLTVTWPQKKNTKTRIVGGMFRAQDYNPDYANPYPMYQRGVHAEACRQAADRVVRRWRALLDVQAHEPAVKVLVVDTLAAAGEPFAESAFAEGGLRC